MDLDKGKVMIDKINTSSTTLEESLKTYKHHARVQDIRWNKRRNPKTQRKRQSALNVSGGTPNVTLDMCVAGAEELSAPITMVYIGYEALDRTQREYFRATLGVKGHPTC